MSTFADQDVVDCSSLALAVFAIRSKEAYITPSSLEVLFSRSELHAYSSTFPRDNFLPPQVSEIASWLLTSKPHSFTDENYASLLLEIYSLRKNLDSNLKPITGIGKFLRGALFQKEPTDIVGRAIQSKLNLVQLFKVANRDHELTKRKLYEINNNYWIDSLMSLASESIISILKKTTYDFAKSSGDKTFWLYADVWFLARALCILNLRSNFWYPDNSSQSIQKILEVLIRKIEKKYTELERSTPVERFFLEYYHALSNKQIFDWDSEDDVVSFASTFGDSLLFCTLPYVEEILSSEAIEMIRYIDKSNWMEHLWDYRNDFFEILDK